MEEAEKDLSPCSTIGKEGDGGAEQVTTDSRGKFSLDKCVCVYVYTIL